MTVPNAVVFYRYNVAGNENAIFQNRQKGRDTAPSAGTLTLLLRLPEQSFHVTCLLDYKATENGVGSFLSLIENVSDLLRITWMVGGKARTGSLMS